MDPIAALTPKAKKTMRFLEIPARFAPRGSVELASMALPTRVRCERRWRASKREKVAPSTQRLWGAMRTPPSSRGCSPEKEGRALGNVPKRSALVLLMQIDAPKVAMMRMRAEALRKG